MKLAVSLLATTILVATSVGSLAQMQMTDQHSLMTPQDIKWTPGPPSVRPGAQMAVLFGDPTKDGLFAMRLKVPKGFVISPHTHSKPEVVTIISGSARLGMGEKVDSTMANALPTGGFFNMPPGMAHYFMAEEDTVIQLNSVGPWTITYVNPEDDPRKQATGVAK